MHLDAITGAGKKLKATTMRSDEAANRVRRAGEIRLSRASLACVQAPVSATERVERSGGSLRVVFGEPSWSNTQQGRTRASHVQSYGDTARATGEAGVFTR